MWKAFLAELHHVFRSNKWRPWEWLFILFIPFLYGFLYMNAYWAPFSKTENLKIAVINLDQGGIKEETLKSEEFEQSDESNIFIKKVIENSKNGFDIGNSNYKFTISDATSIYEKPEIPQETYDKTKSADPNVANEARIQIYESWRKAADEAYEKAETMVNENKYKAVIIIDSKFTSYRKLIKTKVKGDLLKLVKDVADGKHLDVSGMAQNLKDALDLTPKPSPGTNQGKQLVTFYNSYKNNYLAGEMTNFGAGLSKLEMDSILPSEEELLTDILGISMPMAEKIIDDLKLNNFQPFKGLLVSDDQMLNRLKLLHQLALAAVADQNLAGKVIPLFKDISMQIAVGDLIQKLQEPETMKILEDNIQNTHLLKSALTLLRTITSQGVKITDDSKSLGSNINSYGFGLAPYFMCIALWAGSLVMVFLFKNERHKKHIGTFTNYFAKSFVWLGTAWIQAIILTTAITIQGVNFGMDQWQLYLLAIFISSIFALTVQGIAYAFRYGDMADFAAVILLIIQLISSSGTFPVDMQWGLFKILHPVIPFTYAINALREIMYMPDWKVVMQNVGILLIFPAVAMSISLGINWWFDRRTVIKHQDGTYEYKSYEIHLDDH